MLIVGAAKTVREHVLRKVSVWPSQIRSMNVKRYNKNVEFDVM